jgi:hypothetical protein
LALCSKEIQFSSAIIATLRGVPGDSWCSEKTYIGSLNLKEKLLLNYTFVLSRLLSIVHEATLVFKSDDILM